MQRSDVHRTAFSLLQNRLSSLSVFGTIGNLYAATYYGRQKYGVAMPSTKRLLGHDDRIAFIHAIYALALVSVAAQHRGLPIGFFVLVATTMAVLTAWAGYRLRTHSSREENEGNPTVMRRITLINVATAIAALAVAASLHRSHRDGLLVPVVLLIMGVHFLPLGALLKRDSMLWMAIFLMILGLMPAMWPQVIPTQIATLLASIVFGGNALRLLVKRPLA